MSKWQYSVASWNQAIYYIYWWRKSKVSGHWNAFQFCIDLDINCVDSLQIAVQILPGFLRIENKVHIWYLYIKQMIYLRESPDDKKFVEKDQVISNLHITFYKLTQVMCHLRFLSTIMNIMFGYFFYFIPCFLKSFI